MRLLSAIGVFVLALAGERAGAATIDYRVVESAGKVIAMRAWQTDWAPVRTGTVIEAHSLVSVPRGGRLVVAGDDGKSVTIGQPLTFRLSPDGILRLSTSASFAAMSGKDGKPTPDGALATLDEAWKRIQASLRPGGLAPKQPVATGVGVGSGNRSLDLFLPLKDGLLVPRSLPAELRVSWTRKDRAKNAPRFRVIVKKKGAPDSEERVVETDLQHQYVKFDAPGAYTIRVESVDGALQSMPHDVTIAPPPSKEPPAIAKKDGAHPKLHARPPLRTHAPVDGFVFARLSLPSTLTLSWRADAGLDFYDLVLSTEKGVVVARVATTGTEAQVTITRPGRFLWFVEARRDGTGERLKSTVSGFEVQSSKNTRVPTLSAVLGGTGAQSIYYEQ